jgi:prolipoprotein diacylglyceryltransferase
MMKVTIDPILIDLGPFRLSWYGLMYVFGFVAAYLLVRYQMKRKDFGVSKQEVEDLFFYIIIGLIVGARLGYVRSMTSRCTLPILLRHLPSGTAACRFTGD